MSPQLPDDLKSRVASLIELYDKADGLSEEVIEALEKLRELVVDQPPHGSVVMVNGATGTAYQRFYSTGLWARAGSANQYTWGQVLKLNPNIKPVVIYTPPEE